MKDWGVRDAICPGPRLTLLSPNSYRVYIAGQQIVPGPPAGKREGKPLVYCSLLMAAVTSVEYKGAGFPGNTYLNAAKP